MAPLYEKYEGNWELSPFPRKRALLANVLLTRIPSFGHLIRISSHIDAWVGQWKEGIECNIAAVETNDRYIEITGNEYQFYKFYIMHNHHYVVWWSIWNCSKEVVLLNQHYLLEVYQLMLTGVIPMVCNIPIILC